MDYNKPRAYRQGRIEAVKRRETKKKKKKSTSFLHGLYHTAGHVICQKAQSNGNSVTLIVNSLYMDY